MKSQQILHEFGELGHMKKKTDSHQIATIHIPVNNTLLGQQPHNYMENHYFIAG